ncbi:P-loop containing nucleoside triphosphate hydrolase protein [Hygrophoropsis aurantiaca]|uniref:P-loop containing nucleoside triphosphate hydrolase protein n=1 Tax=Hygrophoropsis aurantiaca TaxID=72124 RepID=A0ACB8A5I6_9AGAM|nr:P-loop containing nucleoside triphosphate hydrolase protein [Hygrophoropsis aurantiaca]
MTSTSKKVRRRIWKGKEQKATDTVLKDGRKDDIIIPIMGPTGVGKSSFINTAIGRDVTTVGHDLKSCTAEIVHAITPYPSDPTRRVVFVDTPGFDDTYVDDSEILRRIAVWLARSYSDEMKLAGVIYLHEISQTRMLGTSRKNLLMFRKLCGNDALKNIILATTKWGDVEEDAGVSREEQLKNTFWKDMIGHGSRMHQFRDSQESAWQIVDMIAVTEPLDALQIQKELVDLHKILPETDAGNSMRTALNELMETHKKTVMQLQNADGLQEDEDLQRKLQDTETKLRALLKQIQDMKIPLTRRIMGVFGLRL